MGEDRGAIRSFVSNSRVVGETPSLRPIGVGRAMLLLVSAAMVITVQAIDENFMVNVF